MIDVSPLPDVASPTNFDWGSKVEVRTDKDGKHPYLYALSSFTSQGGEILTYGQKYTADMTSTASVLLSLHRYLYSTKDIKHFRSAVRLRHMTLEDFINGCGFEKVGYDPETMEAWYICANVGRMTDWINE